MSNGFVEPALPVTSVLEGSSSKRCIQTLVIFDLETTGLDVQKERITELGAVAVDFEDFSRFSCRLYDQRDTNDAYPPPVPRVTSKICLPVNPGTLVTAGAAKCSGLDNEMLSKCGNFKSAFDTFYDFLNRLNKPICLVAHNGNRFDFKLLCNEIKRNRLDLSVDYPLFLDLQTYDTMYGFRRLDSKIREARNSAICDRNADLGRDCSHKSASCNEKTTFVQAISCASTDKCIIVESRETQVQIIPAVSQQRQVPDSPSLTTIRDEGCDSILLNKPEFTTVAREILFRLPDPPADYKQESVYRRMFGRPIANAHSADGDCLALLQILLCYGDDFRKDLESEATNFKSLFFKV